MARRQVKDDPEMEDVVADDVAEAADKAPARRRTLGEMASSQASAGVRCPRCGCGHSMVSYTWDAVEGRRRKRICRNCGRPFCTTEH